MPPTTWSLNVPETPDSEFLAAVEGAEPSPTDAPTGEVAAAKEAINGLFAALDVVPGNGYKANASGHSVPHTVISVTVADAAASWN